MNKIDRFCESIMKFEGWRPGSRSYRNANPGNLRFSKFQSGVDNSGYAKFREFADGWAALVFDVRAKCMGETRTSLGPDSTIEEFFEIYAPSSDGNHPQQYAEFVCKRMGDVTPSTRIGDLLEGANHLQ